jgi:hypothetical protein
MHPEKDNDESTPQTEGADPDAEEAELKEPERPVEEPGPTVPGGDDGEEREREDLPPPPTPEQARGDEP